MARHVISEIVCTDPSEHPAVKAWRSIDSRPDLPKRILVLKERHKMSSKSAVYRLEAIDPLGGSIIAKRCRCWSARLEQCIYAEILPKLSLHAAGFRGFLAENEEHYCWLFSEDVGDHWYSPSDPNHRALLGRWLGLLHIETADIAAVKTLPHRGAEYFQSRLIEINKGAGQIGHVVKLNSNHHTLLNKVSWQTDKVFAHWDSIEALCHCLPNTLVHGDLVRKNLRIRTIKGKESLVAVDWENASYGNPAIDLAFSSIDLFPDFTASPDLASYLSEVQVRWKMLNAQLLQRLGNIGALLRCLDALVWEIERLQGNGYVERCMQRIEIFSQILDTVLNAEGWNG